jgi:hypothetical protein
MEELAPAPEEGAREDKENDIRLVPLVPAPTLGVSLPDSVRGSVEEAEVLHFQ